MKVGAEIRAVGLWLLTGLVLASGAWAGDPPSDQAPQVVPSELDRISATDNSWVGIDGQDERVDVDIAILDTGIKLDHPDLNVFARTNCTNATWPLNPQDPEFECTDDSPDDGDDDEAGIWHGSTSAANIAALDNNIGTVGVAAGARLWSVDVSGEERYGPLPLPEPLPAPAFDLAQVIAGVKWVTAHAAEIEVAHIAVVCIPDEDRVGLDPAPACLEPENVDLVDDLEAALAESMAAGVVYVSSAGALYHTDLFVPQRFDDMLTSSQVADTDGLPGGHGPSDCGGTADDESVETNGVFYGSSWGADIDVASIGCAGSHASALVSGAAAVLASQDNPNSIYDVRQIATDMAEAGNYGWTDNSSDGVTEPLLDLSNPNVFDSKLVNRAIHVTNSSNQTCFTTCIDTGYEGELDFADWFGQVAASCDVSFDFNIDYEGVFTLDPIAFSNCWGLPYAPQTEECDPYLPIPSADYYGQLSWPANVPGTHAEIEAVICYRIGLNHYYNRLLLHPGVDQASQRTWTQNGQSKSTGLSHIVNTTLTDTNTTDNVKVLLGAP